MAQLNPQLAPIIQPPQLPYEVFQAQANANVVPQIAALNMFSELLGDKLPKAVLEKQRAQRLAEVFKAVDESDESDEIKGMAKMGLIDDPVKTLATWTEHIKNKKMMEGLMAGHAVDLYKARTSASNPGFRNVPAHLAEKVFEPKKADDLTAELKNLSSLLAPYGQRIVGVEEYGKSLGSKYSMFNFGPFKGKFIPVIEPIPGFVPQSVSVVEEEQSTRTEVNPFAAFIEP